MRHSYDLPELSEGSDVHGLDRYGEWVDSSSYLRDGRENGAEAHLTVGTGVYSKALFKECKS